MSWAKTSNVLYNFARNLNHRRKKLIWEQRGRVPSVVRRIERVHPVKGRRMVAMTFDDGPCAKDFMNCGKGLTASLLDILSMYGAKGTFDIIGTTAENYPDQTGQKGSAEFSGMKYDHYPFFGEDRLGGAVNQPELVRRILSEGHELTSHTYRHRLYGMKRFLYGARQSLASMDEVLEDLQELHSYIRDGFSFEMKLSRPPHFVDHINGGGNAYDAFRLMGYQYLAAGYDADGWQPCGSFEEEVRKMIEPMHRRLEKDPDSLDGYIIFQKDGCNMNLRTPVVEALPAQLKMLSELGYEVVTVSELLDRSPFLDLAPESPAMPYVKAMLDAGHIVGYQNNTFHGERMLTRKELLLMLAPPQEVKRDRLYSEKALVRRMETVFSVKTAAGNELLDLAQRYGVRVDESVFRDKPAVSRESAMPLLAGLAAEAHRRALCTQ